MGPAHILAYWFAPRTARRWFENGHELDRPLRARFLRVHRAAAKGRLDHWAETPAGNLALAIALDQLPRNIFRGTPAAFATDPLARDVARAAVARGHDLALPVKRRMFLYLPFEHSEDWEDQRRGVTLFRTRCNVGRAVEYAEQHRDIIARFGRFPHRNAILGRAHTPEEARFLEGFEGF